MVLAALVAVAGAVLAGCGAGQLSQTAEQRPTIDGTDAQVGPLALRDVAIEYPVGGRYEEGADGRLRMVVVNEGQEADALVEVRTDAAERVTFSPAGSEAAAASPSAEATESGTAAPTEAPSPETVARIEIPGASAVTFRDAGPAVTLVGLTRELRAAETVKITFVFARAGALTLPVAVAVPGSGIPPAPTIGTEHAEG